MNLFDAEGNKTSIQKNDAITVEGDYTLEVDVPWSTKKDVITSDGGILEIFVLPTDIRDQEQKVVYYEAPEKIDNSQHVYDKPSLENKELCTSNKNKNLLNLLLVFDNAVVFKYEDGQARAWQNGTEIKVTNKYLVQTSDGLLKVSFDPKDGETWWVWEL